MARVDLAALQQRLARQQPKPAPPSWSTRTVLAPKKRAPAAAVPIPTRPPRPPTPAPMPTPPPLPPAARTAEAKKTEVQRAETGPTEVRSRRAPAAFPRHAPADAETIARNQRLEAQWLREKEQAAQTKALRRLHSDELLQAWRARWPSAFCDPPVPLKIGIGMEIRAIQTAEAAAANAPPVPLKVTKAALVWWTRRPDYHAALATAAHRVDLNGQRAGDVTERDREHARAQMAARHPSRKTI